MIGIDALFLEYACRAEFFKQKISMRIDYIGMNETEKVRYGPHCQFEQQSPHTLTILLNECLLK